MAADRKPVRRPSTRRARSRGGRPWVVLAWVLALLAVGLAGGRFLLNRQAGDAETGPEQPGAAAPAEVLAGDRAVRVVFPEWDGEGFVIEQRRVPSRGRPDEDLMAVMAALCAGPTISGAISALPEGTRALAAFIDPQDHSAVVDFSAELVTDHPGGSLAEVATLTSILRTVALNFPDMQACTILVDGAPVGTLAGHLDMSRPFDPRRWL